MIIKQNEIKKALCPKCNYYCAVKFLSGRDKNKYECRSTDHIKICNFFGYANDAIKQHKEKK